MARHCIPSGDRVSTAGSRGAGPRLRLVTGTCSEVLRTHRQATRVASNACCCSSGWRRWRCRMPPPTTCCARRSAPAGRAGDVDGRRSSTPAAAPLRHLPLGAFVPLRARGSAVPQPSTDGRTRCRRVGRRVPPCARLDQSALPARLPPDLILGPAHCSQRLLLLAGRGTLPSVADRACRCVSQVRIQFSLFGRCLQAVALCERSHLALVTVLAVAAPRPLRACSVSGRLYHSVSTQADRRSAVSRSKGRALEATSGPDGSYSIRQCAAGRTITSWSLPRASSRRGRS